MAGSGPAAGSQQVPAPLIDAAGVSWNLLQPRFRTPRGAVKADWCLFSVRNIPKEAFCMDIIEGFHKRLLAEQTSC